MKHLIRLLFLTLFAGTTFFMAACSKSDSDPSPQTGSIEGKITPVKAVTTVTATAADKTTFTATPSATGEFIIADLAAGSYVLTFTPAKGFAAPATQTLTVKAGETTKAAAITVKTSSGIVTWTVDGKTSNATLVVGTLQFDNLTVIANSTATSQTITFALDGFNGKPGTYTAGGTSLSQMIFSQGSNNTANQWAANILTGGTGSIKVTAVNASPRRFSGTFSGTLAPATSTTTGKKTITGTFTDVLY